MKLYVTMTDKFMSSWGKAENKINKYIVECNNWEEAETIERNAQNRPEMKYININTTRPRYNNNYIESWAKYEDLGQIWKN